MNGTLIYLIVVGVIFIGICCVVEFFNVFKNILYNYIIL